MRLTKWKNLVLDEAVFASNGNFFEEKKVNAGLLVLTKKSLYLIYRKGLSKFVLHAKIPLEKILRTQVTGKVVRVLEFDYRIDSQRKRVKFVSLDKEVRDLVDEIEYAADNL
jgi:hypothetical protein